VKACKEEKKIRDRLLPGATEIALEDAELVIHRYGLSERSHYEYPAPTFPEPWSRRRAMENIRALFQEVLEPEDLLTLLWYEDKTSVERMLGIAA